MKSSTLRVAVLALSLFGAALGFSYTVAAHAAEAGENCNCYAQFDCPPSCDKGGMLVPNPPFDPICTNSASGPCTICKCW